MDTCDEGIEKMPVAFSPCLDPAEKPLPPNRKRNQPKGRRKGKNTQARLGLRSADRAVSEASGIRCDALGKRDAEHEKRFGTKLKRQAQQLA